VRLSPAELQVSCQHRTGDEKAAQSLANFGHVSRLLAAVRPDEIDSPILSGPHEAIKRQP